jgi:hypothetical protein
MKTKGEDKQSGLAQTLPLNVCDAPVAQALQVMPLVLTCPFGTSQTPDTRGLRHPWTWKLAEQSENVYENKGFHIYKVQKRTRNSVSNPGFDRKSEFDGRRRAAAKGTARRSMRATCGVGT